MLTLVMVGRLTLGDIGTAHLYSTQQDLDVRHSTRCGSVIQPTWIEVARILTFVASLLKVVAFEESSCCTHTSVLLKLAKTAPWHAIYSTTDGIYTHGQHVRAV